VVLSSLAMSFLREVSLAFVSSHSCFLALASVWKFDTSWGQKASIIKQGCKYLLKKVKTYKRFAKIDSDPKEKQRESLKSDLI